MFEIVIYFVGWNHLEVDLLSYALASLICRAVEVKVLNVNFISILLNKSNTKIKFPQISGYTGEFLVSMRRITLESH